MLLLQYDNGLLLCPELPLNGEIAVCTRELVWPHDLVTRHVGLYFALPKVEALAFWNPSRRDTHIGNHELNRPRFEQLANIFASQ